MRLRTRRRLVAAVLEAAGLPFVAIESDIVRFRAANRLGHRVVFGDPSRRRVLEPAGISRARVVVVTFGTDASASNRHHRSREPSRTGWSPGSCAVT
jgi:monovalent cation:H+ antiporter-2, CPA2 family